MHSSALASLSAFDSPPNSTSSQPSPSGSIGTCEVCWPLAVMSWISRESIPSRPVGPRSRIAGTWSAASKTLG